MKLSNFYIGALSVSLASIPSVSHAVTFYWDGDTDGSWTNVTNWDTTGSGGGNPVGVPTSSDDVSFTAAGSAPGGVIDLGGVAQAGKFDIQSGADSFIIGSGAIGSQTLQLSNNFISRSNAQTVNADIELASNKSISNRDNNDALTINGQIRGIDNITFGNSDLYDDGLVVLNGGIDVGAKNVSINGHVDQVVRFNAGTYTYNYLNVKSGTAQFVDSSLDSGGRYVLGGVVEDGTLEYTGTGDLTLSQRFDVGSLNGSAATETGGAVFKASQATGKLVVSGLHGTNANPTVARSITLSGANTEANEVTSVLRDINGSSQISVNKQGEGNWTLSGTNTYTGATTVEAGTLVVNRVSTLYGAVAGVDGGVAGDVSAYNETNITVKSGATLAVNYDQAEWTEKDGSGAGTMNLQPVVDQLSLAGAGGFEDGSYLGLSVNTPSKLLSFSIADTGDGTLGLVKLGSGQLRLNKAHTFTGDVLIKEGVLELNGGSSGGQFNGNNDIVMSSGTKFLYNKTGDTSDSGVISGAGSVELFVDQTAVVTLTGTNTYTGGTTVNGGTLLINGDSSAAIGAVSVSSIVSTATLGGTGSIGGDVTVGANGILAPGASIETLEVGALSFVDGSAFNVEVDSDVATSVGADLTVVNGDLDLAGAVALNLSDLGTGAIAEDTVFSLISYSGVWNDGLFTIGGFMVGDGETFLSGGQEWMIEYASTIGGVNFAGEYLGGGSFVNLTAVPEPSAYGLAAGLLGLSYVMVRRRV